MEEKKMVLYVLTDQWNEWEGAYAVDVINSFADSYEVKTISEDGKPQRGMSGIVSMVDFDMRGFEDWDSVALIIMPGGLSWEETEYPEIEKMVSTALAKSIPVCAICGSTTFLCRKGFLNEIRHTGDSREWFLEQKSYGYMGESLYEEKQVVYDGGIMTANETAAVEFAYEIMNLLEIETQEDRDEWFDEFQLCRRNLRRV